MINPFKNGALNDVSWYLCTKIIALLLALIHCRVRDYPNWISHQRLNERMLCLLHMSQSYHINRKPQLMSDDIHYKLLKVINNDVKTF